MSTLEEHVAEQAEITAMCKAGECDHPECRDPEDDDDKCRTCGEQYDDGGDGFDGECPDCADTTYMDEIVDRSAPRWAWDAIDELLGEVDDDRYLDDDGDYIIQGTHSETNKITDLRLAAKAMGLSCERGGDQPITRRQMERQDDE